MALTCSYPYGLTYGLNYVRVYYLCDARNLPRVSGPTTALTDGLSQRHVGDQKLGLRDHL